MLELNNDVLDKWQDLVDMMALTANVPAGLIMRVKDEEIEVFVSSQTEGNPYTPGDKEHWRDSGLYCETVINSRDKLHVPNALTDEKWNSNPDIKLNMVSYLGFPIMLPDGEPFGTICVLDNKENSFDETQEKLMLALRELIQHHLALTHMNEALGEENNALTDYLNEIRTLRGIVPICANCKNIRDDQGFWSAVEEYVGRHSLAEFSHSICPTCVSKLYPDLDI